MKLSRYTNKFKKDLRQQVKRGKDPEKLLTIIEAICEFDDPPEKYRPHNLIGNWKGFRECHVEPDWLLIYVVEDAHVTFYRTGTHSDLFD